MTRAPETGPDMQEIVITGGLPGNPENDHASAGALSWHRELKESVEAFHDRCRLAATAAGEPFIVFGGLPLGVAANGI